MKFIFLALLPAAPLLAQNPFNATNVRLSAPAIQATAASVSRVFSLSAGGVGETLTPTVLWSALVLTGTVDTTDISGFSAMGRNLVAVPNPSAISFFRVNADNTVTARSATELKTDLFTADGAALALRKATNAVGGLYIDYLDFAGVEAGYVGYGGATWDFLVTNSQDANMQFYNDGAIRLTIEKDTGDVGIGITAPTERLDVVGNAKVSGSLAVGGGTAVAKIITGAATVDMVSIAADTGTTFTITVTGALSINIPAVSLGWSISPDSGLITRGYVSAADTVTVTVHNTTAAAIDPASLTCRAVVTQY